MSVTLADELLVATNDAAPDRFILSAVIVSALGVLVLPSALNLKAPKFEAPATLYQVLGTTVVALSGPTKFEYRVFTLFCPPEVRTTFFPCLTQ